MLSFRKEDLRYENGKEKEWLIANGLGGYASSTIIGLNTRKYHGLLISSLNPPTDRYVQLANIEEELHTAKRVYCLGCNKYPNNIINPEGYKHLYSFVKDIYPTYVITLGEIEVQKSLICPQGENAVIIFYKVISDEPAEMKIRPLVTCRNIHEIKNKTQLEFRQAQAGKMVILKAKNLPTLMLGSDKAEYEEKEFWLDNIEYEKEQERGYDYREDLFVPGEFRVKLKKGVNKFVILATGGTTKEAGETFEKLYSTHIRDYEELFKEEQDRIKSVVDNTYKFNNLKKDPLIRHLTEAADSFLVYRKSNRSTSIIAGYHWFADWGRDSMISLPGLTLVTGRVEEAEAILKTFAKNTKKGLVPNLFLDKREIAYNSVDASLWFIYAVHKYVEHTNKYSFVKKELWKTMKDIISSYKKGTEYKIKMEKDGLISAGDETLNITWMDAKTDGKIATPRHGKAVEIQTLWYNALKIMNSLGMHFKEEGDYNELAEHVRKSFNEQFWNEHEQCLYDVIRERELDGSVRPNQIFAVSLPYRILDKRKEILVVKKVTEELLTPVGLRSLSRKDHKYRGIYIGDQATRDLSYHNGVVWGWLLGPYITAYLKIHDHSEKAKLEAEQKILQSILDNLREGGVGTISEIFDDKSYTPRGCISQAWSVAETLRAYIEDVKH